MQPMLSQFFERDVHGYVAALTRIEERTSRFTNPDFDEHFEELCAANLASLESCRRVEQQLVEDKDLLRETRSRFREIIQPWFDQSWFMERAKSKPRGYPGDFETLTGIYQAVPRSRGLGGYLDLYFLHTPLAIAVRDRLNSAQRFLQNQVANSQRPLSILNVACGPSREFTHGWLVGGPPITVTFVDMDQDALQFVDQHVRAANLKGLAFTTKAYNALRMGSAEANVKVFGRPDIIYSIGLCDYIPDGAMIRILRGWRESLAERGIVYVAFKDGREYDQTGYAWHVDWHFVPRTQEDCLRLLKEAGYDLAQVEVRRGESPIIMSFVCGTDGAHVRDSDATRINADVVVG